MCPFPQQSLGRQSLHDVGIAKFLWTMERSLSDKIDTVIIASILHQNSIHSGHFDSHFQCYLLQCIEWFGFHSSIYESITKLYYFLDLEWQQLYPLPDVIPGELLEARCMSLVLINNVCIWWLWRPLNVIIIMEYIIWPWRTLLAIIIICICCHLSRDVHLQLRAYFQSLFGLRP